MDERVERDASHRNTFPWEDALAFALGILRWTPETFWRATPRELGAAYESLVGRTRHEPAGRGDLMRMMEAFPDG
ncbi:phage tail assembly chaperone [Microvirga pudoricolor]|uniref:phage tail assembly chaperone n=1 Tax=Microvirga pudoricolor TaxID=2778729 RepID=UPI00194EBFD9|nr:phage tail assembly chaperone [Microvirga pudoricolor]MBM6592374.1 phage tail assembly chaperone [Microvirga pudoricolor]